MKEEKPLENVLVILPDSGIDALKMLSQAGERVMKFIGFREPPADVIKFITDRACEKEETAEAVNVAMGAVVAAIYIMRKMGLGTIAIACLLVGLVAVAIAEEEEEEEEEEEDGRED